VVLSVDLMKIEHV